MFFKSILYVHSSLIFFNSMWHELRVVLHNRENTLVTQAVKNLAREERAYSEGVAANWANLVDAVEGMPFE